MMRADRVLRLALYATLAVYAAAPFIPGVGVTTAGLMLAYALGALSVALLMGHGGLVSFGHGLYYAVGAYTVAMLLNYTGIHELTALTVLGLLAAGAAAAAAGVVSVKHRGVYFAMVTLALGQLFYVILLKFYTITGGSDGLPVSGYTILGVNIDNPDVRALSVYYLFFALAVAAVLLYQRILSSPFGHLLRATRDDEHRVAALGASPRRILWLAFTISGFYAGLGGILNAFIVEHVTPDLSYWVFSGTLVFIALLGGVSTALGPLLGALVYGLAFAWLNQLIPEYWRASLGAVMLLIVFAAAGGLEGLLYRVASRMRG